MALYKRTIVKRLPDGTVERHKSATWYYDFIVNGRRHKGCTGLEDKKLARQHVERERYEIKNGRPADGPKAKPTLPTFEEYAGGWRMTHGKDKASAADDQSILNRALNPYFGRMRLDEITRDDVVRFRSDRLAGKLYIKGKSRKATPKIATVMSELALLRTILNVAVEDDLLAKNPAGRLSRLHGGKKMKINNRRDRVIDAEEYARLLLAVSPKAPKSKSVHCGAHLRPMMILAYETGMREGEILGLRWSDVDFAKHKVRLTDTKNGETRNVPLSRKAEKAFRDWGRGDSTYVFPAMSGEGHIGHVSKAFGRLAQRAKVQDVRFHDFRHTFCTRMVEAGTDLITLKAITGHKTLAMLAHYTHPSEETTLRAVRHDGGGFVGDPPEQTKVAPVRREEGGFGGDQEGVKGVA